MSSVHIRCGVDRLISGEVTVRGIDAARLAMVSHAAAVTSSLQPGVSELCRAGISPALVVTPEHGFSGGGMPGSAEVPGAAIGFAGAARIVDGYRRGPEYLANQLEQIDMVLIDLSDFGARCSTYLTMLDDTLAAARLAEVEVVVLDRPNPLGRRARGPMFDTAKRSYVGRLPAPLRHGLSFGECARMLAPAGLELTVVPVSGWDPRAGDDPLRLWVPPSPNLPTPTAVLAYTGSVLLEGIGGAAPRGTTLPYQLLGGDWLTPEVIGAVGARQAPGLRLRPTSSAPTWGPGAGQVLPAVQIHITDPQLAEPLPTVLDLIAAALRQGHELEFLESFSLLAGTDRVLEQLHAGDSGERILAEYAGALDAYAETCSGLLLYPGEIER